MKVDIGVHFSEKVHVLEVSAIGDGESKRSVRHVVSDFLRCVVDNKRQLQIKIMYVCRSCSRWAVRWVGGRRGCGCGEGGTGSLSGAV